MHIDLEIQRAKFGKDVRGARHGDWRPQPSIGGAKTVGGLYIYNLSQAKIAIFGSIVPNGSTILPSISRQKSFVLGHEPATGTAQT